MAVPLTQLMHAAACTAPRVQHDGPGKYNWTAADYLIQQANKRQQKASPAGRAGAQLLQRHLHGRWALCALSCSEAAHLWPPPWKAQLHRAPGDELNNLLWLPPPRTGWYCRRCCSRWGRAPDGRRSAPTRRPHGGWGWPRPPSASPTG